jgi:hypothetical protein
MSVVLGKVVLDGPAMNLFRCAIGPAIAVRSTAIPLLKELLILALEFAVEDDTADARALAAQTLGRLQVRAIDVGVVRQLTRLAKTRVELLQSLAGIGLVTVSARPSLVEFTSHGSSISLLLPKNRRPVMTFENVSTLLCENDERTVVSGSRNDVNEARFLQVPEVADARVERTFLSVAQVAGRDYAEGANDGERARLGAAQPNVTTSGAHGPAFGTARQVEVPQEHIARVERSSIARI